MKSSQIPVARKEGLVIQETPEEVLVYDLTSNKAHCLNETAAFVWKSCDGTRSVSDISAMFKNETGAAVPEDLVWLAIDQLSEKNLMDQKVVSNFAGTSRREVIKKIGLAAVVALPVVASLAAPTSALAAVSCSCTNSGQCAATNCPSLINCNVGGVCAP